jgi:hypothetical protein
VAKARGAKADVASPRSPLMTLIVAQSLVVQLVAVPRHQALGAPGLADPEIAKIAAETRRR